MKPDETLQFMKMTITIEPRWFPRNSIRPCSFLLRFIYRWMMRLLRETIDLLQGGSLADLGLRPRVKKLCLQELEVKHRNGLISMSEIYLKNASTIDQSLKPKIDGLLRINRKCIKVPLLQLFLKRQWDALFNVPRLSTSGFIKPHKECLRSNRAVTN